MIPLNVFGSKSVQRTCCSRFAGVVLLVLATVLIGSHSRGLSTRGRDPYSGDKPPVFILADRGTGQRNLIPAKAADESTIRLLLADAKRSRWLSIPVAFIRTA